MRKQEFWLAQKINGKIIKISKVISLKKAEAIAYRWREKGYFVLIQNKQ